MCSAPLSQVQCNTIKHSVLCVESAGLWSITANEYGLHGIEYTHLFNVFSKCVRERDGWRARGREIEMQPNFCELKAISCTIRKMHCRWKERHNEKNIQNIQTFFFFFFFSTFHFCFSYIFLSSYSTDYVPLHWSCITADMLRIEECIFQDDFFYFFSWSMHIHECLSDQFQSVNLCSLLRMENNQTTYTAEIPTANARFWIASD